jgi:hypothetical protein
LALAAIIAHDVSAATFANEPCKSEVELAIASNAIYELC